MKNGPLSVSGGSVATALWRNLPLFIRQEFFPAIFIRRVGYAVSEIIGKGIFYLRPVRSDDREKILHWRNLPDVSKYMYSDHQITEEEHNRWFDKIMKDGRSCKYWIIVYDKGEIGLASITDIDEVNKRGCYASYIVGQNLRGKGFGTIAEYYILRYFFEDLGLNKICAEVFSFNKAGINVHKSLGFREEGLYRQHRIKNGEFLDVVALAMLRSEWNVHKPRIEKKLRSKGVI